MTIPTQITSDSTGSEALRKLARREEILEICYWYQGEGFGDCFTADSLTTFLTNTRDEIVEALEGLVADGALAPHAGGYRFSAEGKKKAAHLFHEAFADFQVGTHGECSAGCCDSEDEQHLEHQGERT